MALARGLAAGIPRALCPSSPKVSAARLTTSRSLAFRRTPTAAGSGSDSALRCLAGSRVFLFKQTPPSNLWASSGVLSLRCTDSEHGARALSTLSSSSATQPATSSAEGEVEGANDEVEQRNGAESHGDPPDEETQAKDQDRKKHDLERAVESAKAEALELKEKLLRALAEAENSRARLMKEIETTRSYAVSSFSLALLEVGDSLGLALKSMETQLERLRREDPEGAVVQELEKFAAGVRMTENLFLQTLEKFGIVRFPSELPSLRRLQLGEKFDPSLHEALFEVQDKTKAEGTVAQVLQEGFKIKGRILRAAKVGVVRK